LEIISKQTSQDHHGRKSRSPVFPHVREQAQDEDQDDNELHLRRGDQHVHEEQPRAERGRHWHLHRHMLEFRLQGPLSLNIDI
jgi:hypothetical protein